MADMAKVDFSLYWPHIAPGGVMAFHDIAKYDDSVCDKWRWWREIRDSGPQVAMYEYAYSDKIHASMGIGVLFKGNE